jgi:hypothetical protein
MENEYKKSRMDIISKMSNEMCAGQFGPSINLEAEWSKGGFTVLIRKLKGFAGNEGCCE